MTVSDLQKSTIVRVRTSATRTLFRTAEVLAPWLGARVATDRWFRIPVKSLDPTVPADGTPFEVTSQRHVVRGTTWGDGPVVYLMHGWGGRGSQLAAYVDPLVRAGHRVVMFDAPSHGDSDPGPSGAGYSHGPQFGHALDAVASKYGPAKAVIAHSMGAVPALMTLKYGWLGAERLVFLAPMARLSTQFDVFQRFLGFGPRTRRRMERYTEELVGFSVGEFDVVDLASRMDPYPTLIVHDRGDRQTSYAESLDLAARLPDAELITTDGLGHHRILRDTVVVRQVLAFVENAAQETDVAFGRPA